MRISSLVAFVVVAGCIVLFGFRSAPYIRGRIQMRALERKFDAAKQSGERLGSQIRGDPRYENLRLYAWPMEGVILVFEGSVGHSNDLAELKRLVDAAKVETPVRWKVAVSNAPAVDGER